MTVEKIDGVYVLKNISPYKINKIDLNTFFINDSYIFYYDYEKEEVCLKKNDDVIYQTADPAECMDMLIYVKSISRL